MSEFVDADVITRGISGFDSERAAFADNSGAAPRLVAAGRGDVVTRITDRTAWEKLQGRGR